MTCTVCLVALKTENKTSYFFLFHSFPCAQCRCVVIVVIYIQNAYTRLQRLHAFPSFCVGALLPMRIANTHTSRFASQGFHMMMVMTDDDVVRCAYVYVFWFERDLCVVFFSFLQSRKYMVHSMYECADDSDGHTSVYEFALLRNTFDTHDRLCVCLCVRILESTSVWMWWYLCALSEAKQFLWMFAIRLCSCSKHDHVKVNSIAHKKIHSQTHTERERGMQVSTHYSCSV